MSITKTTLRYYLLLRDVTKLTDSLETRDNYRFWLNIKAANHFWFSVARTKRKTVIILTLRNSPTIQFNYDISLKITGHNTK